MQKADAASTDGRRGASFLVRFWWEEREGAGRAPVLRGYLRNLHSGEERHLADPGELPGPILRHLVVEPAAAEARERGSNGGFGLGRARV